MSFTEFATDIKNNDKLGEPFTPNEMIDFAFDLFFDRFGYKLPINGPQAYKLCAAMISRYKVDAPKLIKWIFYQYRGKLDDKVFSYSWLNSKRYWWFDQELHRMKVEIGEVRVVPRKSKTGLSLAELMTA